MFDPHKLKYHSLYWKYAWEASYQSVAERHKVGAVVITPTGMISPGWNGMPEGLPNQCENEMVYDHSLERMRPKTDPRVIHAEHNALRKMWRQGIPTEGSILLTTLSPCLSCSKLLVGLGLKAIIYAVLHDETEGIELLTNTGTPIYSRNSYAVFDKNKGNTLPS